MLQAQLELIEKGTFKGLDAQCVSNLIWAMVKLDVSSDPSSPGYMVVQNASPLVMYFLSSSSTQVSPYYSMPPRLSSEYTPWSMDIIPAASTLIPVLSPDRASPTCCGPTPSSTCRCSTS